MTDMADKLGPVLDRLWQVVDARKDSDPEQSYVAAKLAKGVEHCAKKVGEEAVETAMAAVQSGTVDRNGCNPVVAESADLIFHLMILWARTGVTPEDVALELSRREGVSGHVEKAARS